MPDSSGRIPFAGLENPAWAGWSHGDVPCEPKKRRAPHGPANCVRVQVSQGMRSGQLVDRPLPMLPMRAPDLILDAQDLGFIGGFPYSRFRKISGFQLTFLGPLMAICGLNHRTGTTTAFIRNADIRVRLALSAHQISHRDTPQRAARIPPAGRCRAGFLRRRRPRTPWVSGP